MLAERYCAPDLRHLAKDETHGAFLSLFSQRLQPMFPPQATPVSQTRNGFRRPALWTTGNRDQHPLRVSSPAPARASVRFRRL